jgi:GTP cyclohydrolase II
MKPQDDQTVCARIPTEFGEFQLCLYADPIAKNEHLSIVMGDVEARDDVLVRVHSECFTGDLLGSLRCDCGDQLHRALAMIAEAGEGVLIYLRQEGRGIGLRDKLRAYNLQDQGYDTVDANLALGHQADEREYTFAAKILRHLGVNSISLITNNPSKIEALKALGVDVRSRTPLAPSVNPENEEYLLTKVQRMNHLFSLEHVLGSNGPDD